MERLRVAHVAVALAIAGLALPIASAQLPPALTITIDPLPTLRPLQGVAGANITIEASCAMVQANDPSQRSVAGRLVVKSAPAWVTAAASPSSFVVDPTACGTARTVTIPGRLILTASQDAPAGRAGTIVVEATTNGVPNASASAEAAVEVAFFGQLDVNIPESIAIVKPGETRAFVVKLSNFGNDATTIHASLARVTEGFGAGLFADVTLPSKQQGATMTSVDVTINVTTPLGSGSGYVNQVGSVDVHVSSWQTKDPSVSGDSSNATFVVTAKGLAPGNPARQLGGGALALSVVALALVAASRARRGR